MQWTVGHVEVTTGVKGVGDFIGKLARGAVTNESAVKPEYHGNGVVVLEPTYAMCCCLIRARWAARSP